jgi:hypothetical protein
VARLPRSQHPLYELWRGMVRRCHDPKATKYENYGGRGIEVCPAWRESFERFVADIPDRPSRSHTLDRIDNDGNYELGNVRWATKSEQRRNTRFNRRLRARGRELTLDEWSQITGIPKSTLFNRVRRGWDDERVVNMPAQAKAPDNSLFPPGGRQRVAELGLNPYTVASRLRRGWTFEAAISKPVARKHASKGR